MGTAATLRLTERQTQSMDIKAYRQSVIQALKFLLSQQNEDGSMRPVEEGIASLYKVPYALAAMGQGERAARLCAYIQENVLDEEGDFTGHFPRSPLMQRYYLVPGAWIIAGAQRLGYYGISLRAIDFLTVLQHAETGGFFTAGPAATVDGEQDVLSTAVCGLALLACGRTEEAAQAAQFLCRMWEVQPAAAARLYLRCRKRFELVTDLAEEDMDAGMISVGKKEQWYHVAGLAAGFLTKVSEVTGSADLVATAQKYLNFVDGCGPDRYTSEKSGFFGWAAAIMHAATGNINYRRIAISVADGLLEQQLANGSWLKGSMGEDITSDVVDGTAEGIICMLQILEALSAGE